MLAEGQVAPDFTLEDQHGAWLTLSQWRGQPVVVYFYPKDHTPGCTLEACGFRDSFVRFIEAKAQVIGISPDSAASHKKFAVKHSLPFTLLADPERKVCQLYGVLKEKTLFGVKRLGVARSTFVIDAQGVIRKIFPRVTILGHVGAVLDAVRAIEKG
jgi:peroxiredoxin Q/BCP